jgi:hypothetical protein
VSASTAPAAKAALLAIMKGSSDLAGVQVSYAHPGIAEIGPEAIYMGRVHLEEAPRTTGQHRRESYVIELVVDVTKDGNDGQASEERMWAIVGVIEGLLRPVRQGTNLNGAVTLWAEVEGISMTPYINQAQRLSEAVVSIRCKSDK